MDVERNYNEQDCLLMPCLEMKISPRSASCELRTRVSPSMAPVVPAYAWRVPLSRPIGTMFAVSDPRMCVLYTYS